MLPRWIKRPFDRARLKDPGLSLSCSSRAPRTRRSSIDCETTGLDPREGRIVTVAAVKIRGARILTSERFEATVRPLVKMNPEAIKIHRSARARRRDGARDGGSAAGAAAIHRRPAAGRLLPRIRLAMLDRYLRRWLGIELPNPRDRGFEALLRAQIRRCAAGHACRPRLRGDPAGSRPAHARSARRLCGRADDGDDLSGAARSEGARRQRIPRSAPQSAAPFERDEPSGAGSSEAQRRARSEQIAEDRRTASPTAGSRPAASRSSRARCCAGSTIACPSRWPASCRRRPKTARASSRRAGRGRRRRRSSPSATSSAAAPWP